MSFKQRREAGRKQLEASICLEDKRKFRRRFSGGGDSLEFTRHPHKLWKVPKYEKFPLLPPPKAQTAFCQSGSLANKPGIWLINLANDKSASTLAA